MLGRCGHLDNFANTCFRHFFRFDANAVFSSFLVHDLFAREITIDRVGDSKIWFEIGQHRLRFLKYEFCLVVGLKFGEEAHISKYSYILVPSGVYIKYWLKMDVDMNRLRKRFCEMGVVFEQPSDALNMALVLFTKTFLFGSNYRKKVSSWLFTLVEELE